MIEWSTSRFYQKPLNILILVGLDLWLFYVLYYAREVVTRWNPEQPLALSEEQWNYDTGERLQLSACFKCEGVIKNRNTTIALMCRAISRWGSLPTTLLHECPTPRREWRLQQQYRWSVSCPYNAHTIYIYMRFRGVQSSTTEAFYDIEVLTLNFLRFNFFLRRSIRDPKVHLSKKEIASRWNIPYYAKSTKKKTFSETRFSFRRFCVKETRRLELFFSGIIKCASSIIAERVCLWYTQKPENLPIFSGYVWSYLGSFLSERVFSTFFKVWK